MEEFVKLVSTVGFPIALIGVVGIAIWRTMIWLAPRIDDVVKAHISLVRRLEGTIEQFKCRFRSQDGDITP